MGHLLHLHGEVDARQMRRYESAAARDGKRSFKFAWVLDETDEERARGVTVDIANAHFQTVRKAVTVLDAPGHRDYTANAITGAVQADVAVLVVDARPSEFEAGFEAGGQTREHCVLVRALGVQQLVVAVNKMDAVDPLEPEWPRARFDEIVRKLSPFCKKVGFKMKVRVGRAGGWGGSRGVERGDHTSWSGPCARYVRGGDAVRGGGGAREPAGLLQMTQLNPPPHTIFVGTCYRYL